MIIQKVQDLTIGAIGQLPVREIRLPVLVWLISFEADVAVSGTLFKLRDYQPMRVEYSANVGNCRWLLASKLEPCSY